MLKFAQKSKTEEGKLKSMKMAELAMEENYFFLID
jgi:hypothetical protein